MARNSMIKLWLDNHNIFFKQGKRLAILIDNEVDIEHSQTWPKGRAKSKHLLSRYYITQSFRSRHTPRTNVLFDLCYYHSRGGSVVSENPTFRSFHISHDMNITREAMAFIPCLC
jgi:hypothetical protein